MAENGRDAVPTLRPFYTKFGRGRKVGPNGIETGVHKFVLGALQPNLRASAVSLVSLAVGNIIEVLENRTENRKIGRTSVQKSGSCGFLENPRLWRFSTGSQKAESMIKVPENGREGVCVEVVANAFRDSLPKSFQRWGET